MALQNEVERIKQAKADIKSSLASKGVDVGSSKIDAYASFIDTMEVGGGDIEEYFETTITNDNRNQFFAKYVLKKIPRLTVETTNLQACFSYYRGYAVPEMDTSNVTNMYQMFEQAIGIVTIPQYDMSNVTDTMYMFNNATSLKVVPSMNTYKLTRARQMFYRASVLTSVGEIIGESLTDVTGMFQGTKNLFTDFGGIKDLGKAYLTTQAENYASYTLDLSVAPNLTHDSLMNVINKLYDIKSKGCANQSLVLGTTNLAKLTAEEIAIATNKGWNVS